MYAALMICSNELVQLYMWTQALFLSSCVLYWTLVSFECGVSDEPYEMNVMHTYRYIPYTHALTHEQRRRSVAFVGSVITYTCIHAANYTQLEPAHFNLIVLCSMDSMTSVCEELLWKQHVYVTVRRNRTIYRSVSKSIGNTKREGREKNTNRVI